MSIPGRIYYIFKPDFHAGESKVAAQIRRRRAPVVQVLRVTAKGATGLNTGIRVAACFELLVSTDNL